MSQVASLGASSTYVFTYIRRGKGDHHPNGHLFYRYRCYSVWRESITEKELAVKTITWAWCKRGIKNDTKEAVRMRRRRQRAGAFERRGERGVLREFT
jgi:hypothetical protein